MFSLDFEGVAPVTHGLFLGSDTLSVGDLGSAIGTVVNGIPVTARTEVDYPAFIQLEAESVVVGDAALPEALNLAADATIRPVREGRQGVPSSPPFVAPDLTGRSM